MGIKMRHHDIAVLGEAVDDHQFRTVWEPRGWERAPAEVIAAADATGELHAELDDHEKADLHTIAAEQGLDVPAGAEKSDIAALLEQTPAAKAAEAEQTEEA